MSDDVQRLREEAEAKRYREALEEIEARGRYFTAQGPRHPQNAEILANLARAALGSAAAADTTEDTA